MNIIKNPLQLADNEVTLSQNAEVVYDANPAGVGALTKRGGLSVLNSSALAGSVLGMLGLNLKTTYVRTLYAARGTATANTFARSTNGTVWTNTALPLAPADPDKFTDANGTRDARRMAAIKNFIVYPGNAYTKGTDKPPIDLWDGTNAYTVESIPFGPSATAATPAYAITDWLTANGVLYLAVHDPGGAAPALAGRVMSLNLESGVLKQVANAFGSATGEQGGGYPSALSWYKGQLYVGLNGSTTTDGIGTIVRAFPGVSTTWTADTTTLSGHVSTLAVFNGDLYVGTQSSSATGARIYKQASNATAYTVQFTSAAGVGDTGHIASMMEYNLELYAVEYYTSVINIKKSADGTTWTTDRDVVATDGATSQLPAGTVTFNNGLDLYYVFRATTATATDGFILRKNSGSYTKVLTDNLGGPLAILVERS